MTEITISNNRFDLEKSNNYILSIRVSPDGFLFSILDHFSNTYLFFREEKVPSHLQTEKLETLLYSESFLQSSYYRVIYEHCDANSTLMPVSLFDANKAKVYFEFDNTLSNGYKIEYNNLSLLQVVNVFSFEANISELLEQKFGRIEKLHQHTTLLAKAISAKEEIGETSNRLSLQVHKGWFDLLLFKGEKLQLLNAYEFIGHNDILYFILNALKQFNIAPIDTSLRISGNEADELYKLLSDYVGVVLKEERTQRAEFAPEFFTIPAHQYSNFFYTPFCEL